MSVGLVEETKYVQESLDYTIGHQLYKNIMLVLRNPNMISEPSIIKITEFLAKAYDGYEQPQAVEQLYGLLGESYKSKVQEIKDRPTLGGMKKSERMNADDIRALLDSLSGGLIMSINTLDYIKDLEQRAQ